MTIPNQLTILRIILAPIFAWFFLSSNLLFHQISLLVFIIAALTDWYDGWLARKFNYMSNLGKFLDPLADKILTSVGFIVFIFVGVLELWMVVVIVVRDLMITILRIFAQYKNQSFSTSFLAKVKTFTQMVFLYYILVLYIGKSVNFLKFIPRWVFEILLNQQLIYYTMLAVTLLTFYTGISYLYSNRYNIEKILRN
ncbi:MAG: CDP-diacylglycerol--glycerol-3-phosphate 3-phosphatidyltransferase [Ignavibacteria bacterium]|nr:CDP-diacylglycerol--glycerol-3-phosphate 3-phosphatidyltransferase [Ignavibacteria bacterium]